MGDAMGDIVVGGAGLVLGMVLVFMGLRLAWVALPLTGFVAGVFTGAVGAHLVLDSAAFASWPSWLAGLVVGLLVTVAATCWWYLGVLVAAGVAGATIMSAVVSRLTDHAGGVLVIAALFGAVTCAAAALELHLPPDFLLVTTAVVGATLAVTGALLILGWVDRSDLVYGTVGAMLRDSDQWLLPTILLALSGIVAQLGASDARLPADRWMPAPRG